MVRGMNCVSPPKTRREPIHGGSNPASMRDTVFGGDTQSMPLIFVGQQCHMMVLFYKPDPVADIRVKTSNEAIPDVLPKHLLIAQPVRYCIHHHHHPLPVNRWHL